MDLTKVTIETDRLLLVPVGDEHVEEIHAYYRLPLTKYMNHLSAGTMEELKERHKKWRKQLKDGERLFMAVTLRDTGAFLGCFAIDHIGEKNPEMGGWLKADAQGKGYGKEAVAAMREWANSNIEYEHMLWPCAIENVASCGLAESLGGVIHREYDKQMVNGAVWPARDYWIPRQS